MAEVKTSEEPWHHNPWVWLVIAIPSLTVAGCMFTIYLALTNPHIIVSDGATSNQTTGISESGVR